MRDGEGRRGGRGEGEEGAGGWWRGGAKTRTVCHWPCVFFHILY